MNQCPPPNIGWNIHPEVPPPNDGQMHKMKKKRKDSTSSNDSSSSSCTSSSSCSSSSDGKYKKKSREERRKDREERRRLRKEKRRLKKQQKSDHKRAKHDAKKERKLAKKLAKESKKKDTTCEGPSFEIPIELMSSAAKAPQTKEQYEARQKIIRRVFDPTTGRERLIKGDGEILEEIVCRKRHVEINKQATEGDGMYFQKQTLAKKK